MRYDNANGIWINSLLGKKIYQDEPISTEEIEDMVGLSIKELVMCWLFESKNNFRTAITEWSKSGARISYREIQGY